jgi:hypothetical protein
MPPKLNRTRAVFVLSKIDAVVTWEQRKIENGTPVSGSGALVSEIRAGNTAGWKN